MTVELRFQDPSSGATRYLLEEVVGQLADPETLRAEGVFAFATRAGILSLVEDPLYKAFMERGGALRLIVGLDAITDEAALATLLVASGERPAFSPLVFWNSQPGLFHPKLIRFHRSDGSMVLIVGSGNFTTGGLRLNIEAYSVALLPGPNAAGAAWDEFEARHAASIREIDDQALERGRRNKERAAIARAAAQAGQAGAGAQVTSPEVQVASGSEGSVTITDVQALPESGRVLVARMPRGGSRWHQGHFNAPIVESFLRVRPDSPDRLFLAHYDPVAGLVEEPARPLVYSTINRNQKVELSARAGSPYPPEGRPLLIMREVGLRQMVYMILMPGEPGHAELDALLITLPRIGPGEHRSVTDYAAVKASWPGLPI